LDQHAFAVELRIEEKDVSSPCFLLPREKHKYLTSLFPSFKRDKGYVNEGKKEEGKALKPIRFSLP